MRAGIDLHLVVADVAETERRRQAAGRDRR